MIRKLAVAIILALVVSIVVGASSGAQARTCRRLVIIILDDPYFAHPICTDLPLPVNTVAGDLPPAGPVHL